MCSVRGVEARRMEILLDAFEWGARRGGGGCPRKVENLTHLFIVRVVGTGNEEKPRVRERVHACS